jgi:hypothetical protein
MPQPDLFSHPSRPCMKLVHVRHTSNEPRWGRVDVCGEREGHVGPHKGQRKGIVWEQGKDPLTGQRSNKVPPKIISYGGDTVAVERD